MSQYLVLKYLDIHNDEDSMQEKTIYMLKLTKVID